ncbi:MAG TPA: nucleotide sugar dehydrogenase [Pyrinomonadaceae bacterium]|nr:nucleotide sugar dehydrogenase [Pyrinomonadaceae bacterium]
MYRYSIIGLGKLGASIAAAIASRGHRVIGVDQDEEVVKLINAGRAPVHETGLDKLIAAHRGNLRATTNYREAICETDLTFVIVPTPSNEQGGFSLDYVAPAFVQIGAALEHKSGYHLVCLTSTLLPGATRTDLLPVLEAKSGKVCGRDFGLCYSPTFIALGTAVQDFLHPDFNLIGEFDERSGSLLVTAYAEILPQLTECRRMTIENAELAKISLNSYVTMKITFANMLADLCERVPGGDVDIVTAAIGLDKRIGQKYLTGALGYGGPCFPRDNLAFDYFARSVGTKAELAQTVDRLNRVLPEAVLARLGVTVAPGETVAVLGLGYKPQSHITEASQGLMLARVLARQGARVIAHDPLLEKFAANELNDDNIVLKSLNDCLQEASTVVIANPDPAYASLEASDFAITNGPVTVVDCWRMLAPKLSQHPKIVYSPIGRSRK